jgi:hypothetical protein
MRKAELEAHHDEYSALQDRIKAMLGNREFPAVFSVCVASFPHIVPAIKYRKQSGIEPETPDLMSFRVICKYAPPLFEHTAIEALVDFVKSTRQLARHENDYLQTIEDAFAREEMARAVWNDLERQLGLLERDIGRQLGLNQKNVVEVLEVWEELGVIIRKQEQNTYRLYFRSRLDAELEGICPTCSVRGRGHRSSFFKPTSCKKCATQGYYHIQYAHREEEFA